MDYPPQAVAAISFEECVDAFCTIKHIDTMLTALQAAMVNDLMIKATNPSIPTRIDGLKIVTVAANNSSDKMNDGHLH